MSNIMSLKDRKNHVSRNGFDVSGSNCFTAKIGELLPVYIRECVPGSKHKVPFKARTRTIPLNSAAYTQIKEYYDFFFVPYRLLWRFADQFFINTNDSYVAVGPSENGNNHRSLPTFSRKKFLEFIRDVKYDLQAGENDYEHYDMFGRSRADNIAKLAEYLDYGRYDANEWLDIDSATGHVDKITVTTPDIGITPFGWLAYQKIYNDYYRFSQWESNQPTTYNIDYVDDNVDQQMDSIIENAYFDQMSPFELRYANWHKDLFMGLLPSPQYGDESTVSVFGSDRLIPLDLRSTTGVVNTSNISNDLYPFVSNNRGNIGIKSNSNVHLGSFSTIMLNGDIGQLSILAMRQGEALQKWKEITFSGNEDYRTQIKKHFGVDPGPLRSKLCEFIDGYSQNVEINAVINNNLATSDDNADIKGMGVVSGKNYFDYEAKEHGILLGIYHAQPLLDYAAVGINPLHLKIQPTDFVIPEFDKIGMQPVPYAWLNANSYNYLGSTDELTQSLGYAPRYIDMKTNISKVRGGFLRGLKNWSAYFTEDMLNDMVRANIAVTGKPFNYTTFKVPPYFLDVILSVKSDAYDDSNSDHLICQAIFDDRSVEPIDRDGLPY